MDIFFKTIDNALRTVFAKHHAQRPNPAQHINTVSLTDAERVEAGALMRVNHVGEICAQALYASQALTTRNPQLKAHFRHASQEETDHLAWTEARLADLGARPSLLNPLSPCAQCAAHGGRNTAAHRAGRQHLLQHDQGKNQGHARQRRGTQLPHVTGFSDGHQGRSDHGQHIGKTQTPDCREDRGHQKRVRGLHAATVGG